MKLTPVNKKLANSMYDSIDSDVYHKTFDSASRKVYWKIRDEIRIPNFESIEDMQRRTLENLQNEINASKR